MRLAWLLLGYGLGVASVAWWIARSMATPEPAPPMTPEQEAEWMAAWRRYEDALPPFDPRQWEHMLDTRG